MKFDLHEGDCLDVMKGFEPESVHSVVTDPPYGLSFMNKRWDYDVPSVEIWKECLRVLKPGGYLLSFGGARTYHRLVVNIEDAGFEIRDQVQWVYGSGFPKGQDAGKLLEKKGYPAEAEIWRGWNTTLKPANEPICLARKPFAEKTLADNLLVHGAGALNIDGCRIGPPFISAGGNNFDAWRTGEEREDRPSSHRQADSAQKDGRWPTNLIHEGSADEGLGSASRFFYCAKASRKERGEGNDHSTVKPLSLMRYLCRLVTPTGGAVLDPFMGSGSTGVAALREDFSFIGIEKDPKYKDVAQNRIDQTFIDLSVKEILSFYENGGVGIAGVPL